jgi:Resolvase, N terminal domain
MPKSQVKPSEQPPAVGYICVDEAEDGEIAAFLKEIAVCCLREELRLVRTFCDQGYDGTQLARPGIVELRQALLETSGLVVIVPTLDHLSPADSIRSPLTIMIHRLGARLVVAEESEAS